MLKILLTAGVVVAFLIVSYLMFFSDHSPKVTKNGPIIFFGDSLTAGFGAGFGEDFPSLIARELSLVNYINAGVGGNTSVDALARLENDVLSKDPSLVVVEFSGNDWLQDIPAAETIKNLEEITRKIKQTGAEVILVHLRLPESSGEYEDGYKKLEKDYNIKVVWNILDGIISKPDLMSDSIHPNADGYKIMASRIVKPIKDLTNL